MDAIDCVALDTAIGVGDFMGLVMSAHAAGPPS